MYMYIKYTQINRTHINTFYIGLIIMNNFISIRIYIKCVIKNSGACQIQDEFKMDVASDILHFNTFARLNLIFV